MHDTKGNICFFIIYINWSFKSTVFIWGPTVEETLDNYLLAWQTKNSHFTRSKDEAIRYIMYHTAWWMDLVSISTRESITENDSGEFFIKMKWDEWKLSLRDHHSLPSLEYVHAQFSHMVAECIHKPLQSVIRPQATATCSMKSFISQCRRVRTEHLGPILSLFLMKDEV